MLAIKDVTKKYNRENGIEHINLTLKSPGICALIGPNGAGKTTLIRSIAGALTPDAGRIMLDGKDTRLRTCKKDIGYAPDSPEAYPKMTVMELLDLLCEVKYDGGCYEHAQLLLHDFDLWDNRNKLISACSTGMRKKLEIVIALTGSPKLILLDEPTDGVDTGGIIVLKHYLRKCVENSAQVLLASHVLDFIETVSMRNIFIKAGRIVADIGQTADLESEYEHLYL